MSIKIAANYISFCEFDDYKQIIYEIFLFQMQEIFQKVVGYVQYY